MSVSEDETLQLREDILRLKQKLNMEKNDQQYGATVSVFPENNLRTNRGNKMDPTSDTVNKTHISSSRDNFKLTSVDIYNNSTKEYESKLVYINKEYDADLEEKIRLQIEEEFGSDGDDNYIPEYDTLVDEKDDPYMTRINDILNTVRLDQLMKPITKPSDVINTPSINNIYKSQFLEKLSLETIAIIEKEQENVNLLNRIMEIFLHKDPKYLLSDTIGLPEYDHHLDQFKQTESIQQLDKFSKYNHQDDPFFQLPSYETDPKFDNINPDEVDETRQLIQIALQRNEEFIRSLAQVRLGFEHANNYKTNVYNWCKEMNDNELAKKNNSSI